MADSNTTTVITPSEYKNIDWKDIAKSGGTAAGASILVSLYLWASNNTLPTWLEVRAVIMSAVAAFLGNILRSAFTNSAGQFLKKETPLTPAGSGLSTTEVTAIKE
jgi:hypothetical protein